MPEITRNWTPSARSSRPTTGHAGRGVHHRRRQAYMLQTRNGKRTAAAALQIAVDMVESGMTPRRRAWVVSNRMPLTSFCTPPWIPGQSGAVDVRPQCLSRCGCRHGGVHRQRSRASRGAGREGDPGALGDQSRRYPRSGLRQGVITSFGGMTSHAAVVARGMGRPCIAGASDVKIDPTTHLLHRW